MAAEGAGDFRVLRVHGGSHDAGKALKAEGVCAVQLFWRFEDIVIGVEADGALGMRAHLLQVSFQQDPLGVPHHWARLHLTGVQSSTFFLVQIH